MNNGKSLIIKRENSLYTSCYCEENIWKLCEKIKDFDAGFLENCFVIFVSNDAKQVPVWFQKPGRESRDYLCVWDYHVFLVQKHPEEVLVYDFDTVLEFPTSFDNYVRKAIKPEYNIYHERLFRVIPAEIYLSTFASDRSHMRKPDGSYMSEPPDYMPIKTEGCTNNIHEFISMKLDSGQGEVMNLEKFCLYFMPNK